MQESARAPFSEIDLFTKSMLTCVSTSEALVGKGQAQETASSGDCEDLISCSYQVRFPSAEFIKFFTDVSNRLHTAMVSNKAFEAKCDEHRMLVSVLQSFKLEHLL